MFTRGVSERMLTYAHVCSRMLTYADACRSSETQWCLHAACLSGCSPTALASDRSAYVSIRQHTSAYVSIRQHTSAHVQHTSAYVSIRQHTSAYVSIRSAYVQHTCSMLQHTRLQPDGAGERQVSIRQHTSAYVSIRQHTFSIRGCSPTALASDRHISIYTIDTSC